MKCKNNKEISLFEHIKLLSEREEKVYTSDELDELIQRGWTTKEEIYAIYDFVDNAKLINEEELKKFQTSGWINVISNSYEIQKWLDEKEENNHSN